jgi:hypothetical protein
MPLYFAYGSNMDTAAMADRCPHSAPLGAARLVGHRFIVSGDGYASVRRDPRHVVWGLLWDLALADVAALDRYESLSSGLYTKVLRPVLTSRGPRRAMVYVGRSPNPGAPRTGHLEAILEAAAKVPLPEDYRRMLETWRPDHRAGDGILDRPAVRPRAAAPATTDGIRVRVPDRAAPRK